MTETTPPPRALPRSTRGRAALALGLVAFALLATLNTGGYRYGVGDQAFYAPAVEAALHLALFPHDRPIIDAQGRLELFDTVSAVAVRATGLPLPWVFALGYLAGLLLLGLAATLIGRRIYATWWGVAALGLALTFRHRIAKTGVNTLEGYLHPRMLAWAVGLAAVAAFLRGRYWLMAALVVAASVLHPTIGAWFAVWLTIALAVAEPRWLRPLAALAALGALAVAWAVLWGPLAGRLVRMDEAWLAVLASKDYLFPDRWPLDAWLVNLAYPIVIVLVYRVRRRAGLASARETGLVVGSLALVAAFLATLPLVAAGVALAVQLQIPRMFWFLDFLATVYVVWALTEHPGWRLARWRVATVAVLAAASLGRGVYVTIVDGGRRPGGAAVVRLGPAQTDWEQVMRWLQTTPAGSNVLADPGHAWRYGTSVRAAALRDVYLEEVKDSAIAIYSRDVAMRVADRIRALGPFDALTAAQAQALAAKYDLDYLVTERDVDLPIVFRAGPFRVYRLRGPA
jgi:hypothetical protein